MAIDIKVPTVGESITEGTIARWLKKHGAAVRLDEPLFELETDKASQEVASPAAGVLTIQVQEGEKVAIGAVVGAIDPAGVPAEAKPASGAPSKDNKPGDAAMPIAPAARRLATESGVNVAQLHGSGKGGLILKEDVQIAMTSPLSPPGRGAGGEGSSSGPAASTSSTEKAPSKDGASLHFSPSPPTPLPGGERGASGPRETRKRMSAIRQRIADKLVASQQTTASLTTFNEADLSAVMDLRTRYKDSFQKKHGVGLGFMAFFVKAAAHALKAYPVVNARLEGVDIVYQHDHHIGVAVSTDKGLMVPVLRDVDRLSCAAIEKSIAELAVKAREGKIGVQDLQGGTFTITNGGIFGSMLSTPILNPPQCAILGMHAIQKRPVVRDDQIVIRPMMYLALTYDHRLIDGREAVQFLVRIKECVEDPERMLLDI